MEDPAPAGRGRRIAGKVPYAEDWCVRGRALRRPPATPTAPGSEDPAMTEQSPSQAEGEREGETHEDVRQTTPSQAEGERDDNDEGEPGPA
ncbi:hypothetical protein GCM10009730_02080 [Streptomyces albidochromogenes]